MNDDRIPVDLLGGIIRGIVKHEVDLTKNEDYLTSGFEIELRPGLIVEGLPGKGPTVKHEGCSYALADVPAEIEHEILTRAKEHREYLADLQQIKYVTPSLNPMIKVDPGD